MQDTISRYLAGIGAENDRAALRSILTPIADRMSTQAMTSAGLVIKTAGSPLAKTGATAFQAVVRGVPVTIAPGTDMPALSGSVPANQSCIFCFFVDSAGALSSLMGTPGATPAAAKFPNFPAGKALVGYLVVTYASPFVGGTTPLDTATTIYVSPVGAFDPSIRL